jgi:hypothetical protein
MIARDSAALRGLLEHTGDEPLLTPYVSGTRATPTTSAPGGPAGGRYGCATSCGTSRPASRTTATQAALGGRERPGRAVPVVLRAGAGTLVLLDGQGGAAARLYYAVPAETLAAGEA